MKTRRPLFIVNPNAGGKTALRKWLALEQTLRNRNIAYDVSLTERCGHGAEVAADAYWHNTDCIVAVGGDGTLNEVVNGILQNRTEKLPLVGFVAAGSSNDFIKSFEGGNGTFLARLFERKPRQVDVGKIECRDGEGRPVTRYFLVNSTIGVVAGALEFFNRTSILTRTLKRISVDLAVIWSALNAIARHESRMYRIAIDGKESRSVLLTNLAVLRGSYFGGGMSYGDHAKAPQGRFNLVGIDDMSKFGRVGTLSRFYRGSILSHPRVWRGPAREILIEADRRSIIEADGELVGFLPARFSISGFPLNMIY